MAPRPALHLYLDSLCFQATKFGSQATQKVLTMQSAWEARWAWEESWEGVLRLIPPVCEGGFPAGVSATLVRALEHSTWFWIVSAGDEGVQAWAAKPAFGVWALAHRCSSYITPPTLSLSSAVGLQFWASKPSPELVRVARAALWGPVRQAQEAWLVASTQPRDCCT